MCHLTAWEAHTGSVSTWLQGLVDAGDITLDDIVWSGGDGSYAVGEDWPTDDDFDTEMVDSGTVDEYIND